MSDNLRPLLRESLTIPEVDLVSVFGSVSAFGWCFLGCFLFLGVGWLLRGMKKGSLRGCLSSEGWKVDGWVVDGWVVDGWVVDRWLVDGWVVDRLKADG